MEKTTRKVCNKNRVFRTATKRTQTSAWPPTQCTYMPSSLCCISLVFFLRIKRHSNYYISMLNSVTPQWKTSIYQTDVLYLDFRKAFDTVPHDELLLKLWNMGITGNVWKWFRAYLGSRQQCVCINGQYFDLLPDLLQWSQHTCWDHCIFLFT